jgi:Cyclopropane fatty acid synthase and related methyltransferases
MPAPNVSRKRAHRRPLAASLAAGFGISLAGLVITAAAPTGSPPPPPQEAAGQATQAPKPPDVIYVPTPQGVVVEMLKVAEVKPGNVVYDLGCGDGRIVITAAKDFGARGVGVDIDPKRIEESNANAKAAGVTDKVKFVQQDLFEMDFRDADVVALYLLPTLNVKLRPKLLAELKPGARVVSHSFDMGEWKPDKTLNPEQRSVYLWVIPAKVEGTWEGTAQTESGEKPCAATLTQTFQEVTGTVSLDGKTAPIRSGRVNGDLLELTVMGEDLGLGDSGEVKVRAKVSGDTLTSADESMPWKATRKPAAAPKS